MEAAGSAVGIASLGIKVCQGLLSYYDGWKDYGSDITSARDSIADLCHTLILLKDSLENGGLDGKRTERVKSCLESCNGGLAGAFEEARGAAEVRQTGGVAIKGTLGSAENMVSVPQRDTKEAARKCHRIRGRIITRLASGTSLTRALGCSSVISTCGGKWAG